MNILFIIITVFGVGYIYHYNNSNAPQVNKDMPLIITDYLNNGQAELARKLSRVEPFIGNIESYSGFLRVSDDCIRNMFFWYFPAQNGNTSAPLLVWLQGGPGGSSLFGLLAENGPYSIDSNDKLNLRPQSWTQEYSVVYIDNPVGTGFSFAENECYLSTEEAIGFYLSKFMYQFYQLFPNLVPNPLYITGESYAGKYIPAMAYAIDKMNRNSTTPINLVGMIIGDGLSDPYNMMDYGAYLFRIGLIFDNQVAQFDYYRDLIRQSIDAGEYLEAFHYFDVMLNGDITPYPTLFTNLTGLTDYFDYNADFGSPFTPYDDFVQKNSRSLNAGNLTFKTLSDSVYVALYGDMMRSVAPYVQEVINAGYKTLFFSGQFDIIVAYPLTSEFLKQLEWNGKEDFTAAPQKVWFSKNGPERVNGYVRSGRNVMQILVRNSGHMVPSDQPTAALEMLRNFIYDLEF